MDSEARKGPIPTRPQPSLHPSPDLGCRRPPAGPGRVLGAGLGLSVPIQDSWTPVRKPCVQSPASQGQRPGSDCVPGLSCPWGLRGLGPLCHLGTGPVVRVLRARPTPLRELAGQHVTRPVLARASLLPKEGPQSPATHSGWQKPTTDLEPLLSAHDEEVGGARRGPAALAGSSLLGHSGVLAHGWSQCPQGTAPSRPAEPGGPAFGPHSWPMRNERLASVSLGCDVGAAITCLECRLPNRIPGAPIRTEDRLATLCHDLTCGSEPRACV